MKRRVRSPVTAGYRQMRIVFIKMCRTYPDETKSVKEYMLCADYIRGLVRVSSGKKKLKILTNRGNYLIIAVLQLCRRAAGEE